MLFFVESNDGESVQVEAPNWMMAMSKAMAFMDIDPNSMVRWVCKPSVDGSVSVSDPVANRTWKVVPNAPALSIRPSGNQEAPPTVSASETSATSIEPPPSVYMPSPSRLGGRPTTPPPRRPPLFVPRKTCPDTLDAPDVPVFPPADQVQKGAPSGLAERIFDLSFDMMGAAPTQACNLAMTMLQDFVPCAAGSILRGTLNDTGLTFIAVRGPVKDSLIGRQVPWGTGLVGLCFDLGFPIQVADAGHDARHLAEFDQETGFHTEDVLCVPIKNEAGSFGVIQLLNPSVGQFDSWHVDATIMIAQALAEALGTSNP